MNIQRTSRTVLLSLVIALLLLVQTRAAVMQSGRAYAFSMPAEWRYASEPVATLMHQRTGVKLHWRMPTALCLRLNTTQRSAARRIRFG